MAGERRVELVAQLLARVRARWEKAYDLLQVRAQLEGLGKDEAVKPAYVFVATKQGVYQPLERPMLV
jgi:hypothetical protein